MTDKISVIVPVYNVKKYIKRCLDSIIEQTYKNLEIILIDDGSTDGSGEICDEYIEKDERIQVLHKANGGLSSARNIGIERATGNYIGFVDSDDWIAKDMYEYLWKLCKRDNFDIAVCGIKRVIRFEEKENASEKEKICIYTQEEYLKKFFRVHTQDPNHFACNKLYRSQIIKQIRYPEGLTSEDVEGTFLALLLSERIILSEQVKYFYWNNPDSITNQKFNLRQMDLYKIWCHVYQISRNRCNKEMQYYALVNLYRVDFSLLCKLAITEIDRSDLDAVKKCQRVLIKRLKSHKKVLLKAPIPASRKIILVMFCMNYPVSRILLKLGKQMRMGIVI